MQNIHNQVDLNYALNSIIVELDAHKVIMAHLYNCIELSGIPRTLTASSLKMLGEAQAVQEQLNMFADGVLASVDLPSVAISPEPLAHSFTSDQRV